MAVLESCAACASRCNFLLMNFRSGSTLLETMLDAHPLVFGLGEDR